MRNCVFSSCYDTARCSWPPSFPTSAAAKACVTQFLLYLRRTEAEALLYDLERGLADGEHYGRFG